MPNDAYVDTDADAVPDADPDADADVGFFRIQDLMWCGCVIVKRTKSCIKTASASKVQNTPASNMFSSSLFCK